MKSQIRPVIINGTKKASPNIIPIIKKRISVHRKSICSIFFFFFFNIPLSAQFQFLYFFHNTLRIRLGYLFIKVRCVASTDKTTPLLWNANWYSLTHFLFLSLLSSSSFFYVSHQTVRHGFPYQPSSMAFDPVQKILAVGTQSGALRLYPFTCRWASMSCCGPWQLLWVGASLWGSSR